MSRQGIRLPTVATSAQPRLSERLWGSGPKRCGLQSARVHNSFKSNALPYNGRRPTARPHEQGLIQERRQPRGDAMPPQTVCSPLPTRQLAQYLSLSEPAKRLIPIAPAFATALALLLQLPLPPPASAISAGKHHGARSTSTPTSALSAALQAPTWQAGPGSDPTILGHNEYTSDGISIGVPDCSGEHGDPRQGRQLGHGPAAALPTASMGPMPLTSPVAASQQLQQLKQQQQQQLQQTFQYHLGWGGSSDLRAKVLDAAMPRGLVVEAVAAAARAVALHPHTSALQREAEAAAASAWASSATSAASSEPSAAAIAPQRESETAMDEGAEGAADAVKAGTGVAPAVEQGQGQGQQVAGSAGGMGTAAVGYGGAAAWAVGRELCAEVVDSLNKHHGPYWQCMAELVGLPNAASAAAASKGGGSSGTGKSMGTSSASVSDSGGTASSSSSSGDGGADGTGADGAGGSGGAVSRGGRLHRGGVCASGAPLEERCRAWRAHEMHVRFVVGAWEFLLFK